MISKLSTLVLVFALAFATPLFQPKIFSLSSAEKTGFCGLKVVSDQNLPFDHKYYLDYITQRKFGLSYQFQCPANLLNININTEQDMKEGYEVDISENNIDIKVSTYSGYVYALETIFSMIQDASLPLGKFADQPQVQFRGIMIDSVRHFLSVAAVKRTIQAMAIVRMNMLHWHLTDDEAFTITLQKHPEMVQGAYDKKSLYTLAQVKQIIDWGKKHAVNIIPEIDTPGHVRSWSQNSKHQGITILCGGGEGYNHQMDLSIDAVWTLAKQIIKQIAEIFKDSPYLHLGGDQVFASCFNRQPKIKEWMQRHNISTYGELQMLWRSELLSVIPNRTVIFWRNDDDNVMILDDQILHYWGAQKDCAAITRQSNSKIIVSPSDYLYLNSGQGFVTGKAFGHYSTWRQIYQNWLLYPTGVDKSRILGTLGALWGQVSNQNTLDANLWPRAIVIASLAWENQKTKLNQFVDGMLKIVKQMQAVGVKPSPFVPQYCQNNPNECRYTDNSATPSRRYRIIEQ